ncbi:hypothetical protein GCM10025771_07650 [Niveibacterium umoris]
MIYKAARDETVEVQRLVSGISGYLKYTLGAELQAGESIAAPGQSRRNSRAADGRIVGSERSQLRAAGSQIEQERWSSWSP